MTIGCGLIQTAHAPHSNTMKIGIDDGIFTSYMTFAADDRASGHGSCQLTLDSNTALVMSSNQIHGLATGTANTDAVNKGQMDTGLATKVNTSAIIPDTEINNVMGII